MICFVLRTYHAVYQDTHCADDVRSRLTLYVLCRWIAPEFYKRKNMQSAVLHQPQTEEERIEAFRALLSCPT